MVFFRGMMKLNMLKFFERRGGGGNSQDRQAERYVYDQNEARRLGAERQERKTVAALLYGNEYLGYPDVQLNNGDEERLLSEMRSGRVGENEERGMLLAIRDPIAQFGADRVTMGISGDKHRSRILAQMSGRGFENWQTVDSQDLMRFMQRFPTPLDFEETSEDFLDILGRTNSAQKVAEYRLAMDEFKQGVYGKRQEYWERIKALEKKSGRGQKLMRTVELATTMMERNGGLESLSSQESEELLGRAKIDGDAWLQDGMEYRLTNEALRANGLEPRYKVSLGDVEVALSGAYKVGLRDAVMAYVKTDKGVKVRSYYRSNSQGIWRYLPDYVSSGNGGIEWYGKGHSEESLTLPMELQEALAKVVDDGEMLISDTNPDFLIAGTAKRYASKDEYRDALYGGKMRGDFYEEVPSTASVWLGQLSREKALPETMILPLDQMPDFDNVLAKWETETSLSGRVTMESFKTRDGKLCYTFAKDGLGRAWLTGVETNDAITSTGLRKGWVSAGNVATPLYEYDTQADQYGDYEDRKGRYVSMFRNYLSRIPLIKDYLGSGSGSKGVSGFGSYGLSAS